MHNKIESQSIGERKADGCSFFYQIQKKIGDNRTTARKHRLEIKNITAVSYFNPESHSTSAALCDRKVILCYAKVLPV